MARDRQRAKQRRRRQAGAGGAQPGARRAARDRAGEEPGAPDAGVPEDELAAEVSDEAPAAPGPLEHSSPWVDEAKLAERGMAVPPPGEAEELDSEPGDTEPYEPDDTELFDEDDDLERAPDEVEGDLVPDDHPVGEPAGVAAGPRRKRGRVLTFLGHCVDELRRVQWPDRRQTFQGTAVVLGFVVLAGSFLGLMDAIWKPIVEAII